MQPRLDTSQPPILSKSIGLSLPTLQQLMLTLFLVIGLTLLFVRMMMGGIVSADGFCAAPWDATSVYATPNLQASHNGSNWHNQWWSQNEEPSVNTNWVDDGPCTLAPTPTPPAELNDGKVRIYYFVEWGVYGRDFFADDVVPNVEEVTHIQYGFINVDANGNCQLFDTWAADQKPGRGAYQQAGNLRQLAALRNDYPHLKILLSLGGWTLSDHFSAVAADPVKLDTMATSCVDMMQAYDFDGLDVDWEYPGHAGAGNAFDVADGANFTNMMRVVRAELDSAEISDGGRDYLLTAAVGAGEDKIADIKMADVAPYMDYISLMTYDFNGAFSPMPAHNAALYINPNDPRSGQRTATYTLDHAVDMYINGGATINGRTVQGGFPANKLVVGLPFYGRSWVNVPATEVVAGLPGLFSTSDVGTLSMGGACNCEPNYANMPSPMWNGSTSPGTLVDTVGNASGGSWEESVFDYDDIADRLLTTGGYTRYWDADAQVPYLYNPNVAGGTFISYDDASSICRKATYIRDNGLAGGMVWEITQNRYSSDLFDAISDGLAGVDCPVEQGDITVAPTAVSLQSQDHNYEGRSPAGIIAIVALVIMVAALRVVLVQRRSAA